MASRALPLKNFVMRALLNPLRMKRRLEPIERWNIVVGMRGVLFGQNVHHKAITCDPKTI